MTVQRIDSSILEHDVDSLESTALWHALLLPSNSSNQSSVGATLSKERLGQPTDRLGLGMAEDTNRDPLPPASHLESPASESFATSYF